MAARCARHRDQHKLIRVDACTSQCAHCGWYYAMVPTRSGARRQWVTELDAKTAAGGNITTNLLAWGRAAAALDAPRSGRSP